MITVFSSSGCSVIKVKNSHFYLNIDTLDGLNGSKSKPIPAAQMVSGFATMEIWCIPGVVEFLEVPAYS